MFLDMVGTIELFVTDEALEGFFISMNVLVSIEEVSPVRGIGTVLTHVPFLSWDERFGLLLNSRLQVI